MIDFGNTLRQAREIKGYTASQLAEKTHLSPQAIEALETENFSSIAAPIYGRGFVRLYCEAVGIDAKPMMDEFTARYSGSRDSGSRPAAAPRQPATPPQAPETPAADSAALGSTPADANAPSGPVRYARPQSAGRYAPPAPDETRPRIPRLSLADLPWRLIALAAVAIAVLWCLIAGVRAICRAVTSPAEPIAAAEAEPAPARPSAAAATDAGTPAAEPGANPAAKRQPQDIPPLYFD